MKNSVKLMLAAASLLSVFSCTKEMTEVAVNNGLVSMTFEAGFSTKTALDVDGKTNTWVAGDKVSVFDGSANNVFTAQSAGTTTTLSGTAATVSIYAALYPYQESASFNGAKITATLPARQKAVLNSFDPEAALAAAVSNSSTFAFKNVVSLVKVAIRANNIESITVKGNNDEVIAGAVEISQANDGTPTVKADENGSTFAKVSNGDGSALTPGVYYVAVLPTAFTQGLSIILTDIDGKVAVKEGEKSVTLSRSSITSVGTVSEECAPLVNVANWYNAGNDILLGGKTFNKAEYGEGRYLEEDFTITEGGVYFVDPMASVTLTATNSTTAYKNLIVVGNDASQRSYVEPLGQFYMADNSTFALANVKYNANLIKNAAGTDAIYPIAIVTNATLNAIIFDNCKLYNAPTKPVGTYLSGAKFLHYVGVVNSEYCVAGEKAHMFNVPANAQDVDMVLFRNNICYNKSDANPSNQLSMFNAGLNNMTVKKLVVTNNTFVNSNPSTSSSSNALFNAKIFEDVTIENNLIYYAFALVKSNSILRANDAGYPTVGSVKNNIFCAVDKCVPTASLYYSTFYAKKATIDGMEQMVESTENPFSEFDKTVDGGIFTQKAEFESYGAKR